MAIFVTVRIQRNEISSGRANVFHFPLSSYGDNFRIFASVPTSVSKYFHQRVRAFSRPGMDAFCRTAFLSSNPTVSLANLLAYPSKLHVDSLVLQRTLSPLTRIDCPGCDGFSLTITCTTQSATSIPSNSNCLWCSAARFTLLSFVSRR